MSQIDPHAAGADMRARTEAIAAAARPPRGPFRSPVADLDGDPEADIAAIAERRTLASWQKAIPQRFWNASTTHFDGATMRELDEWADDPRARNLVLFGPVGTGKSHAAAAAVRPWHFAGSHVLFLPTGRLLNSLRPGGPEGCFERLATVALLIWDDIGREYRSGTGWAEDQIYDLVNMRWMEERPTVFTSNLAPDALKGVLGEAVYDRIVGSDAVVLRLTGKSRRRT